MSYYAYEELIETEEEKQQRIEQQRIQQQAKQLDEELLWENIKMYHRLKASDLLN